MGIETYLGLRSRECDLGYLGDHAEIGWYRETTTLSNRHLGGVKRADARLSEAGKRIGRVKNQCGVCVEQWGYSHSHREIAGDRGRAGCIFRHFRAAKVDFCPISRAWEAKGAKFPLSGECIHIHSSRLRVNFIFLRS